jgi:uncharacterized protein (DUF2252 family)
VVARITDLGHHSRQELIEEGKAQRKGVPRQAHGGWRPEPDRPDPLEVLEESNRTRLPDLVPVRYGRMLRSPFTFFRGAPALMAWDLARTPTNEVYVQACGDAHLLNFGAYASPERHLVFDLNDFDETLPAPWEWDVKRLAASCVVAARTARLGDDGTGAEAAVRGYIDQMAVLSTMTTLDIHYAHIDVDELALLGTDPEIRQSAERFVAKTRTHTVMQALDRLTAVRDGQRVIVEHPPLVVRLPDAGTYHSVKEAFAAYRRSLADDRRHLLDQYVLVDAARKVVGVGSVGLRANMVLLAGRAELDPLFLQMKEAEASVLEPYAGRSAYQHHAERVVFGQRLLQSTSDLFLGWSRFAGAAFYVRQLRDMKGSMDIDRTTPRVFAAYCNLCGTALARAHARSLGPSLIHGYLGSGGSFATAIVDFARAYADQNELDHARLVEAVQAGDVVVAEEC